jgi:hypothetical protein
MKLQNMNVGLGASLKKDLHRGALPRQSQNRQAIRALSSRTFAMSLRLSVRGDIIIERRTIATKALLSSPAA